MSKIILLLLFVYNISYSQDSMLTDKSVEGIRSTKPFYILLDMTGLGFGYSVYRLIDLQATTMVLTSSATVKIYLTNSNSSPFVGYNTGYKYQGFGGNGEGNEWKLLFIGWQYHPFDTKGLFVSAMYQYILYNGNKRASLPTQLSFNFGVRLF